MDPRRVESQPSVPERPVPHLHPRLPAPGGGRVRLPLQLERKAVQRPGDARPAVEKRIQRVERKPRHVPRDLRLAPAAFLEMKFRIAAEKMPLGEERAAPFRPPGAVEFQPLHADRIAEMERPHHQMPLRVGRPGAEIAPGGQQRNGNFPDRDEPRFIRSKPDIQLLERENPLREAREQVEVFHLHAVAEKRRLLEHIAQQPRETLVPPLPLRRGSLDHQAGIVQRIAGEKLRHPAAQQPQEAVVEAGIADLHGAQRRAFLPPRHRHAMHMAQRQPRQHGAFHLQRKRHILVPGDLDGSGAQGPEQNRPVKKYGQNRRREKRPEHAPPPSLPHRVARGSVDFLRFGHRAEKSSPIYAVWGVFSAGMSPAGALGESSSPPAGENLSSVLQGKSTGISPSGHGSGEKPVWRPHAPARAGAFPSSRDLPLPVLALSPTMTATSRRNDHRGRPFSRSTRSA